ncbi:hypothetical protein BV20DRAFT_1056743 [Pilatotrama ljubarskyi]|nr:hypothetical protein BV20DRAFT_1056743 [Pilatotrama ljubarskyi]
MSEEPANLLREARSLLHTFKDSLKTKDPWDREYDFLRKQLRRIALRMLLLHPYAPESKDAENLLWIQTSYAFISLYKQRISALDRAIHGGSRQQQQQQQGQGQQGGRQQSRQSGGHGVVEYRKLLQRFRQYLADEEKFWIQLIVRIRRIFHLDDAQPILAELGIQCDDESPAEGAPPKRNHFQFPSDADLEAAAPTLTPATREQRESSMAMLSKALVCLGDIERYKEQYNEAGGRPRAGHEDGPPAVTPGNQKGGRGRKGGAAPPNGAPPLMARLRDYHKAQLCYQQARLLLPQDGNPAHQMAILASYQKDTFSSLVHYYRALCVRSPYDMAADNLGTVLTKALDAWKARGAKKEKEREKEQARGDAPSMAPRLRVEAFKEKLIVLHALWRAPPEEAQTVAPNLPQKIAEEFKALVSERVLPPDTILKTLVLAQGALWKHRMFRNSSGGGHRRNTPAAASAAVESSIVTHLLTMHRVLLEVGIVQIAEAPPEDAVEHDLAQRITAEFRRTLQALRIGSKWLRANLRYLAQGWQHLAAQGAGAESTSAPAKSKGRDRRRENDRRSSSVPAAVPMPGLPDFWRTYAQFSTALWRVFPQDRLPKDATTFDEDVEMAGFLPLKKFIPNEVISAVASFKDGSKDDRNGTTSAAKVLRPEQVHPNEEQLMRIADLLADAVALARDEICPVNVFSGRFSLEGAQNEAGADRRPSAPQRRQSQARAPAQPKQDLLREQPPPKERVQIPLHLTQEPRRVEPEEDNMTDITRTEDDLIEAAFRHVLGEDSEEDEIVWEPGPAPAPVPAAAIPAPAPSEPATAPVPAHAAPPIPHDPAIVAAVPAKAPLLASQPPQPPLSSPVIPALGPRSPPSQSPTFLPKGSAENTPSLASPPKLTTAQDLLANVMRSPPKGDLTRSSHTRQVSAPSAHMLFGSNPLGSSPSIWSSKESDGLRFQRAAGTPSGPSYQPYHPQNQGRLSHSPAYSLQPPLGLGQAPVPLAPTRSSNYLPPAGHTHAHQRVQSLSISRSQMHPSSLSPQPFTSSQIQSQPLLPDGFGSYPALTEQANVAYSSGVPAAYADPIYSRKLDPACLPQDAPGYPDRAIPYHLDPRATGGQPAPYPPLSSMAELWNNAG